VEAVLRAISDPRRREIIRLVRGRELSAGEIASRFDVSRPAISQHITVLREAGLLSERRDGNRRLYRARPEALSGVRSFVEEFWIDHLDHLKEAAEEEAAEEEAAEEEAAKQEETDARR
jgi:DNA-binding transcriptional ArsR family regulator